VRGTASVAGAAPARDPGAGALPRRGHPGVAVPASSVWRGQPWRARAPSPCAQLVASASAQSRRARPRRCSAWRPPCAVVAPCSTLLAADRPAASPRSQCGGSSASLRGARVG
jgi:hypothetical protein